MKKLKGWSQFAIVYQPMVMLLKEPLQVTTMGFTIEKQYDTILCI